ncbi:GntR family transcriptional regulator [Oceanobacillus indicireducens]|uniref:HTH-type transcriptional regulator YmfC n=1 Tax=Oceanobacillus indicireducens TaxID=1004261 RepID=A0A918D3E9_9BACI|nr:GntR family transcriptional regulator [Oceanobacillus indicireducens]GGN62401.1 putative HTH-type transcriptional regulator YmfC [Oceanobacillus indicireducens]
MKSHYQKPRYLIVIEQIREKINNGELEPGEQLPSETALAKALGVSRNTLREALRILEEENIIIRKHGIGTFVNRVPVFQGGIEELFSITELIEREGKKSGTEILFTGIVGPHRDDIEELELEEDEQVFLVKRVRTADEVPLVYCIDKVPDSILHKGYKLREESIFNSLGDAGIVINHARSQINTIAYHDEISKIMNCDQHTPLLVLRQVHFDESNRPVLYSINYFRSDQITFNVLRKRV